MTLLPPRPSRRMLGQSGIEISALAWGNWRMTGNDAAVAARLLGTAIDAGITLVDTADIYGLDGPGFGGAETLLGRALADSPALRDQIVLATKGGIIPGVPYDSSASYLAAAIDASLKRLHTDRIDLWQIHRPDILTHPHEIAQTVSAAHAAGKIRAFGVSNYSPAQIDALARFVTVPIVSTQPEFSPLRTDPIDNGELDQAIALNLTPLAWSPLGGGRIAQPRTAREQAVAAALDVVAADHGVSRTAATYAWIMAHPARPLPIIGSQRAERIVEAADALKVRWTRASWYAVLVASRGTPLP